MDKFLPDYLGFHLSLPFHQCCKRAWSIWCSYQKDKRAKTTNRPKAKFFWKSRSAGWENVHFVSREKIKKRLMHNRSNFYEPGFVFYKILASLSQCYPPPTAPSLSVQKITEFRKTVSFRETKVLNSSSIYVFQVSRYQSANFSTHASKKQPASYSSASLHQSVRLWQYERG